MVKHRKHKKLRIKLSFSSDSNSSSEDEWEATAHQLALALSAALQATTMAPVSTLAASLAVDAAEPSQPSRHVFADTCFFICSNFFLYMFALEAAFATANWQSIQKCFCCMGGKMQPFSMASDASVGT
jgi:hypothetical protein